MNLAAASSEPECSWRRQQETEKALRGLIDDDDIPDDVLGFHAQQAVEKILKAVLAANDLGYERTHNIAYCSISWIAARSRVPHLLSSYPS